MATKTLTLADFLLARIDEDERAVRYGTVNARRPALQLDTDGYPIMDLHRVLAECDAKREIVKQWKRADSAIENAERGFDFAVADALWASLSETLKYVAQPYAEHPEFRKEWAA